MKKLLSVLLILPAVASAQTWCPSSQKVHAWTGSAWELQETYETKYTPQGWIASQEIADNEGNKSSETYTYTEHGKIATFVTLQLPAGASVWQNSQKVERTYDSRLTSFITKNDQQLWNGTAWTPSNNYTQTITRDGNGNIVKMERAVMYKGVYDPIHRITLRYDKEGKAYEISTQDLKANTLDGSLYWANGDKFTNITWMETDGQITSLESVFKSPNRILSATVVKPDGTEYSLTAQYGEGDNYSSTLTSDDLTSTVTYTSLDDYGSYTMTTVTDYGEWGNETITENHKVDAYDNILLDESIYESPEGTETMRMSGEVVYDPQYGYPLSWTLSELDPESGVMNPFMYVEFSDYSDVSASISDVVSVHPAMLYDLMGRRLPSGRRAMAIGKGIKTVR